MQVQELGMKKAEQHLVLAALKCCFSYKEINIVKKYL